MVPQAGRSKLRSANVGRRTDRYDGGRQLPHEERNLNPTHPKQSFYIEETQIQSHNSDYGIVPQTQLSFAHKKTLRQPEYRANTFATINSKTKALN